MKNEETTTYRNLDSLDSEAKVFEEKDLDAGIKNLSKPYKYPDMCRHGIIKGTGCVGCIHNI